MCVSRITYSLDDIISCSFSSSEHQGNYANESIICASKKVNLSQGFISFFIFQSIFFTFSFVLVAVDPCLNYQCNHGACNKDRSNQAYCSCFEGYGGSRCETQIGMSKRKKKRTEHG
jgi:hypothetical protein